jgi:glycosyltransferase involved in cell wall biosynthesis
MNIAIYPGIWGDFERHSLTVETLARQQPQHRFIILTDQKPTDQFSFPQNIEINFIKRPSQNVLLKKIWWDIKLPLVLKKAKADLFISFQNACLLAAHIPQFIMIENLEKISKAWVKIARLLITPNNLVKKQLIKKFEIKEERIAVIYPSANKIYEPINEQKKEAIKNKYTEGKEFFYFNSGLPGEKNLIDLLKSFSYFKKRQQSNFKLLINAESNSFFAKSLEGYKYRDDVRIIDTKNKKEEAMITASAYAAVLPFNANENMIAALNAARSGVPVVAVKNSIINEVFEDAALYSQSEAAKDIGEKMMQVYTNEDYRTMLIERGKQVADEYTSGKAAELLWQSIIKTLE